MDAVTEQPQFGPAMRALTERQRAFVLEMLADPFAAHYEWCIRAGYQNSESGHRGMASRMLQSPKIQAACVEMARGAMGGLGPVLASQGLLRIAANPRHKDHFRALESVADRVGLPRTTAHQVLVDDVRRDPASMVARVRELAGQLGIDPAALLGPNTPALAGPVIEGEATEVVK